MSELLKWTGVQISRRKFLKRATGATFGVFAGLSVGVPKALAVACCSGPNGQGWCGSLICGSGHQCISHTNYASCDYAPGWCTPVTACWTSHYCSGTCCDCYCCEYNGTCFYCYCHDGGA